jgi:hypothetical protein
MRDLSRRRPEPALIHAWIFFQATGLHGGERHRQPHRKNALRDFALQQLLQFNDLAAGSGEC